MYVSKYDKNQYGGVGDNQEIQPLLLAPTLTQFCFGNMFVFLFKEELLNIRVAWVKYNKSTVSQILHLYINIM